MASPKVVQKGIGHTEGNLINLYLEFPVGAAGAVGTLVRNREITGVTRLGAGNYRVSLAAGWNALLDHSINVIDATPGGTNGAEANISVRTLGGSTPVIEFFTYRRDTGAAADPRDGAVISARFTLQNGQRV